MSDSNKKHLYRPDRKQNSKWTIEEDRTLLAIVESIGPKNWKLIANLIGGDRTDVQCSHRYGKVLKPGIQKGAWREDEDAILCSEVIRWGDSKVKWSLIAEKLQGRLGKQCRERWFNHLDPNINRGDWTASESRILYEAQRVFGNRWCDFTKILPGRTENSIKNRWKSSTMTRWLKCNNLIPSSDTVVTRTVENLVDDIKTFRESLAALNLRVDLRSLLSMCSIESDQTYCQKFLHNGQPLRFKLEDHFDPAEVQDIIDESIKSINNMAPQSKVDCHDNQMNQHDYQSSEVTEPTTVDTLRNYCIEIAPPGAAANSQYKESRLFLISEDTNRIPTSTGHNVTHSLQALSSKRIFQQYLTESGDSSTTLTNASISVETPMSIDYNYTAAPSSPTPKKIATRTNVKYSDEFSANSVPGSLGTTLNSSPPAGRAQYFTCLVTEKIVNCQPETARVIGYESSKNGDDAPRNAVCSTPCNQVVNMNPSQQHATLTCLVDPQAQHLYPYYRENFYHNRSDQHVTVAVQSPPIMYEHTLDGNHNYHGNHNNVFQGYHNSTLAAHNPTISYAQMRNGTDCTTSNKFPVQTNRVGLGVNNFQSLNSGCVEGQATLPLQTLTVHAAALQKLECGIINPYLAMDYGHNKNFAIDNNLVDKRNFEVACAKKIDNENTSYEETKIFKSNHNCIAQMPPVNVSSVQSDCESRLGTLVDPSSHCDSVNKDWSYINSSVVDRDLDCDNDDWDSLFEFALSTESESVTIDQQRSVAITPNPDAFSNCVGNSHMNKHQLLLQHDDETNLNSIEKTEVFDQMLISVHNRIRSSIQLAPILDQSVFCVPLAEKVPMQALRHFEFLNEISQRSLVRNILKLVVQSSYRYSVHFPPNPSITNGTQFFAPVLTSVVNSHRNAVDDSIPASENVQGDTLISQPCDKLQEVVEYVNKCECADIANTASALCIQVIKGAMSVDSLFILL